MKISVKTIEGVLYVNTGDFVESCTAVAEHEDGRFEILHWRQTAAEREAVSPPRALPARLRPAACRRFP